MATEVEGALGARRGSGDIVIRAMRRRSLFAPVLGLAATIVLLTGLASHALDAAAAGTLVRPGAEWLHALAGAFLFAVGVTAMVHTARLAERVAGPEHRLIESLRRLRSGDLAFRVHLRRGDLLTELAAECNEVLEWLNRNPPHGARTGFDVYEVDNMEAEAPEAAEVAP